MDEIITDILVIGGGFSGLVAALTARAAGRDVTLLSRGRIGCSGNTLVSGAAMAMYRKDNPNGDSLETFIQDTCLSGQGLNGRETVERFARESASILDALENYGVSFRYVEGQRLIKQPPGHSVRRSYPADYQTFPYMIRGLSLGMPLRGRAVEMGIHFLESCDVVALDKTEERICGAYALDVKANKVLYVHASAVILSCGGGASLFRNTNNTLDVSADSYRLALEAGATLQDMEFVQFYPSMMLRPVRGVVSTHLFGDGAVLRNRNGEKFLRRYTSLGDQATRDVMARAIQMEIRDGRGDPDCVYMDCSAVNHHTLATKYPELSAQLMRYSIDIRSDLIPVAPTAHFYLGGIRVDETCATGVQGLFACGEALGGLHGANRLSGNALTEAAVTGKIAGECAAAEMRFDRAEKKPHTLNIPECQGGADPRELIRYLRTVMWQKASIIKTTESISEASETVEKLKEQCETCAVHTLIDARYLYQLRSYLSVAELLLLCAEQRKESRGAFYREDYPKLDEAWKGSFVCSKRDGEIRSHFIPAE